MATYIELSSGSPMHVKISKTTDRLNTNLAEVAYTDHYYLATVTVCLLVTKVSLT